MTTTLTLYWFDILQRNETKLNCYVAYTTETRERETTEMLWVIEETNHVILLTINIIMLT